MMAVRIMLLKSVASIKRPSSGRFSALAAVGSFVLPREDGTAVTAAATMEGEMLGVHWVMMLGALVDVISTRSIDLS